MILDLTPTLAVLSGPCPADLHEALAARLRYRPKGYAFDPRFKAHRWDGWQALYAVTDGRIVFPAGLLGRVRPLLAAHGVEGLERPSLRLPTLVSEVGTLPDGLVLRPEQVRATAVALREQRALLDLAPNFGKTEVLAALATAFPDARALILADNAHIVEQDADRLRQRLREPVGVLGLDDDQDARVVVSTIQRLHARVERPSVQTWLARFPILLVDEAHRVTGPRPGQTGQWFPVLGRIPALVRIGVSGSLSDVESTMPAEAYLGPVAMRVTDKDLIDEGRSADPLIVMPYLGHWTHTAEYSDAYEEGIVQNLTRNRMLVEQWMVWGHRQRRKILALVYRKPHGRLLARLAEEAGLRATAIDGDSTPEAIDAALTASRTGAIDVLVASTIANQGWDLPWLDMLINAAAWKSPVATKQKLGRILRINLEAPERQPVVVDPMDLAHETLKRHARARFRLYKRRQFLVYEGSAEAMLALLEKGRPHE